MYDIAITYAVINLLLLSGFAYLTFKMTIKKKNKKSSKYFWFFFILFFLLLLNISEIFSAKFGKFCVSNIK